MYINSSSKTTQTYDAIVVGSGMSGGIAAKELTAKGLKVLMIERGPKRDHIMDYTHATKDPWQMPHHGGITEEIKERFPRMTTEGSYPINETNDQFWMPFNETPYNREKPFDWYRGKGIGGKSLLWGRVALRWGPQDFEANAKEGIAVDWPIRYEDLVSWYSYIEKFVGVSGEKLGLDHFPDSDFQPPFELNCVEKHFQNKMKEIYGEERIMTIGRVAHLTEPTEEQRSLGRTNCLSRNMCAKGCPYGGYYSTNAGALPAAMKTGNLSVLTNGVVSEVIFDEATQKASGVRVIDSETKVSTEFFAKILFLNASTIGTTQIMLNSKSKRFPNGLGNDSGQLGRNLMDHHSRVGASGEVDGFLDQYYYGRRPAGVFIPRFRNINGDKRDYLRGFDFQGSAGRSKGNTKGAPSFGVAYKEALNQVGPWGIGISSFGECLPYEENRMYLHETEKDQFGMPKIVFDAEFKENEMKMRLDMEQSAGETLEACGAKNVKTHRKENPPLGLSKHEMGTARMGQDPKTSVLNKNNQVWGCENVFVTDGACMTSSSYVNPSLTYMALTARAVDFAVKSGDFS
ncbi:MAG: choline dehydrogenase-like flavoprotein [Psychromonas sp.]|jgi:choline dehydrogenase-like flavoprotein